jgi:hypothetical protein
LTGRRTPNSRPSKGGKRAWERPRDERGRFLPAKVEITPAKAPKAPEGKGETPSAKTSRSRERPRDAKGRFAKVPASERPRVPRHVQTRLDAAKKRREDTPAAKRIFPKRDGKGRWRHPKTNRVMSDRDAKQNMRRAERQNVIRNLSKITGATQKEIRKALKGVKTSDIVGKWRYFDRKTGRQKRTGTTKKGERALKRLGKKYGIVSFGDVAHLLDY